MLLYIIVLIVFIVILLSISSRIRKAARLAFESETVETDEFSIVKPEGFISPVNDNSAYAFEAYSKDYGEGETAGNMRQAQAFVSVFKDENFADACARAKQNAGEILSEETGGSVCLIKGEEALVKDEETLENASAYNFYKVIGDDARQKIYELKITVLHKFLADYQNRVDEMLESFRLK
jgi:hypothetical protein